MKLVLLKFLDAPFLYRVRSFVVFLPNLYSLLYHRHFLVVCVFFVVVLFIQTIVVCLALDVDVLCRRNGRDVPAMTWKCARVFR